MDGFPLTGPPTFKPSLIRPVWADPGYFLALYNVSFTNVSLGHGGVVRAAPARPDRWAIGFSIAAGALVDTTVSPFADADQSVFATLSGTQIQWFKLFDFGPLVTFEWYANFGAAASIRVTEVFNR